MYLFAGHKFSKNYLMATFRLPYFKAKMKVTFSKALDLHAVPCIPPGWGLSLLIFAHHACERFLGEINQTAIYPTVAPRRKGRGTKDEEMQ
jgi:hypothetical protein